MHIDTILIGPEGVLVTFSCDPEPLTKAEREIATAILRSPEGYLSKPAAYARKDDISVSPSELVEAFDSLTENGLIERLNPDSIQFRLTDDGRSALAELGIDGEVDYAAQGT